MNTPTRPQLSQLAIGADRHRQAIVILALVALGLALVCLAAGCSTTQSGLDREQHLYSIATNAVAAVERVMPALPPPVASIAEPVLALAAAGLAAWNTWQHKQIRTLQNGQNGKSIAVAPAPPQPPGA